MIVLSRSFPVLAAAGLLFLIACDSATKPSAPSAKAPGPVMSTSAADGALTDYADGSTPPASESQPEASSEPTTAAGLTFFTNRAAFEAEAPDLPLEDFESGNVPPFGVRGCPGPVDATNNNACFSPGAIQPGVQFNASSNRGGIEIALLGPGFANAPSRNIVANFFVDAFIITFTAPNVTAAGMDLVSYFGNGTCQIDISGASGPLGSTTAPCTNAGTFWGVVADQPITQIRINSLSGQAEGTDNVEFGEAVIPAVVDIKPGSADNPINVKANGVIPVAVLTTSTFDASQIDAATLAFGPGAAPEVHGKVHLEDVDGDGDLDAVLHFDTQKSAIACTDTHATLVGRLSNGRRFKGSDVVLPKGCTLS